MRKVIFLALYEGFSIGGGVMADAWYDFAPLKVWLVVTIVCGIGLLAMGWQEISGKLGFSIGGSKYDPESVEGRFKALHPFLKYLAASSGYSEADATKLLNELDMLGIYHPVDQTLWPKYLKVLAKLSKKGDLQRARDIPSWLILKG